VSTWAGSPFEPLRHSAYRRLWLGALCLNLGLWMQTVTAGWLMVSLQGTALQVGLIQTASALPAFLFALPGGVIADLVERRRYLLWSQAALALVAVLMTALAWANLIGPGWLLGLTFAYGLGYAMQGPSWFTAQLDVLPPSSRLAAVSLGSVSYSSARAIGPALAGALMLWFSPALVFGCIATLALLSLVLLSGSIQIPRPRPLSGTPERFGHALMNALRYGRDSRPLQVQLLRTLYFVLPGAALWALLPLIAKANGEHVEHAGRYGLLLGCLGLGAVCGALSLHVVHSRLLARQIDGVGVLLFLGATLAAPFCSSALVLVPLFVLAGLGWAWVANLGVTALQMQAAPHLRARALALYLIVFQGAMALGGALWGQLADSLGLAPALALAAAGLALSMGLSLRLPWGWVGHDALESSAPPH
jgi:MFS family permease